MQFDVNARYAESHEWIRKDGEAFLVGISDHAQHSLGDIVFIDLPKVGALFKAKEAFAVVESVKAAADLYLPIGGTISAVNERLEGNPEIINQDCYGEGWIARISGGSEEAWNALLSAGDYEKTLEPEN
ncbi:MAG: glycine cleavage system protein GcvH [Spirochaetaceae bacterium]|jgi:glycine cleavage system H protein|nr:glycine cleavage system protein GcvH [Spirochaetaceae bacterium]